jgi:hypothetical protein
MSLSIGIALAVTAFLGSFESNDSRIILQPFASAQTVEEYVRDYFVDEPVMIAIASCESQFRHSDKDGKILKNPKSSAVGVFQIMSSIHASNANKNLGLDISTIEGNAAYARHLYEKSGTKPWKASQGCWGKTQAAKDHFALAN